MKKIFKLLSIFIATIATMSIMTNVFAESASTGSITIKNTTTDKTYTIYKIFDLTYKDVNETKKIAYTIDSDWTSFFEGTGSKYISDTNLGNLNSIIIDGIEKYINITEENVAQFSQDSLDYVLKTASLTADKTTTGNGADVKIENLELGYYLVYPKGATNILDGNSSICSLTSTLPDAEVNIKATYPVIDKTVDDQYVDVGQKVTFTVTGIVPDTTGYNSYTYKITDTMTEGLNFELAESNFTIKFGETTITPTDTELTQEGNGFVLNFDMTKYQMYKGQEITITYKATVTNAAIVNVSKNKVILTYSNTPNTTVDTTPIEIPVYSSKITITKIDADDNTIKLSGAKFILKKGDTYYQAYDQDGNLITNVSSTSNVVRVVWTSEKEDASILVSDTNGLLDFSGIENGDYELEEIEAPDGYNKLTSTQSVTVDKKDDNNLSIQVNQEVQVENNTGTELPSTGGFGTKLFIIIGSFITITAGVVLIANKRIEKEDI